MGGMSMIVGLIDTVTPDKVLQRTVHTERGGAGKSDSVVTAVRYSRQPDHAVENARAGSGRCGVRGQRVPGSATDRHQGAAREDR